MPFRRSSGPYFYLLHEGYPCFIVNAQGSIWQDAISTSAISFAIALFNVSISSTSHMHHNLFFFFLFSHISACTRIVVIAPISFCGIEAHLFPAQPVELRCLGACKGIREQ